MEDLERIISRGQFEKKAKIKICLNPRASKYGKK